MLGAGGSMLAPALLVNVNNSCRRHYYFQLSFCCPDEDINKSTVKSTVKCSVCILSSFTKIKISILRGAWDLGTMEQWFVKVIFNEREINTWSWSVTNESICAIVVKLGKQNKLDSSGFPLSNCICNSSLVFMCGCEWHHFPLDTVGLGPWMATFIHRELALKSVFYTC